MKFDSRKQLRDFTINKLFSEYKQKMNEMKVSRQTPTFWHFLYAEEAVQNFNQGNNISCILTSSAFVECVLFWEYLRKNPKRMEAGKLIRQSRDSLSLYLQNLENKGVPVKALLFKHETNFEKPKEVSFVNTRNIFAHGDIHAETRTPQLCYPISDEALDYGITEEEYWDFHLKRGFENIAFIQLTKALKFAVEFTNYLGIKARVNKKLNN